MEFTELCLGTRAILLAPQAMTATEEMAIAGTCVFDHGDQRRRPSVRPSPPVEPAGIVRVPRHSSVLTPPCLYWVWAIGLQG
ncbi:MAG TPA: hypothetical protein VL485_15530 [Ktedonobacteraceae bacterium]|nr:hypothetical protein [Ktedonobacteraceae bacterium]